MSRSRTVEPKVDRRVERTRRTLRTALIELVLARGWDEVSVKDVCDKADVGRSTFYAHFADKEELLTSGFDQLGAHLRGLGRQGDRPEGTVLRFARPLLEHAFENRQLFRALIGTQSSRLVQRRFHRLVTELVGEELAAHGVGDGAVPRFVTGGLIELLTNQLDVRGATPEAVDADLQRMVRRLLAGWG